MSDKNTNLPENDSIWLVFKDSIYGDLKWFDSKEKAETWWGEQSNGDRWERPVKFSKDF